ncbi:MAG: hypothetical protein UT53_C0009G0021 [Candidatus Yanofskybacteria bacterium GW2011_GWD2_39_48]|uniref:Uncharacterized protein n=1 Tax=Candidatus Yanofskybacteria bacterium GW2011_GWD2_39_48 TaxID=1619031 RepID=A0A0G0SDI8_9BACT|nr:MAG: hypothetical protein UT53_C0009G0021 [Candidatus Yanofskybacteria bacterium GW2011_GWD2_39_48]
MSDEQMTNIEQNGANIPAEKSIGFDLAAFVWEVIKTVANKVLSGPAVLC